MSQAKQSSEALERLLSAGWLTSGDAHFARLCTSTEPGSSELLQVVFGATSRALRQGHACLPLASLAETEIRDEAGEVLFFVAALPDLASALASCSAVSRGASDQGGAAISAPLIWDEGDRLYLARFYDHEKTLALRLGALMAQDRLKSQPDVSAPDSARADWIKGRLDEYFPERQGDEEDLQRRAAEMALNSRFCVISGGPGTGKTSTVVKILALLAEEAKTRGEVPPFVQLLAPTGKAAARMMEAIHAALAELPTADDLKASLTSTCSTIHRALGVLPGNPNRFNRGREHPLRADVVIVDEASMVDLALMRHLVDSLKDGARLLLLGDRHQLASVEAGSVLAELCGELARESGATIELLRSYRFSQESGIFALAQQLKRGSPEGCVAVLTQRAGRSVALDPDADLFWEPTEDPKARLKTLRRSCVKAFSDALRGDGPEEVLSRLGRYRILCAHRRGPFGVEAVNQAVVRWLVEEGVVPPLAERGSLMSPSDGAASFYRGRLILVTENDYGMGLHNGDTGIVWPDEAGKLCVFVQGEGGVLRRISPAQLPSHETAFALTIHKSQGSEYDEVAVILPEEHSPLLTRELVYTAVTRAKRKVHLFGSQGALEGAARASVTRHSGLAFALGRSFTSPSEES